MLVSDMFKGFYWDEVGDVDGTNEAIIDLGETRTPVSVMFMNEGSNAAT